MKILIIASNKEQAPFPVAPIGALYIAAAAKSAGHEVDLIDMAFVKNPVNTLRRALKSATYDVIGLSIRNLDNCFYNNPKSYFVDTLIVAEAIRKFGRAVFVLGGSGFSVEPAGWMRRLKADFGIVGEGERSFVELLNSIQSGKSPDGIKGVITPDSCELPEPWRIDKLNDIALPMHERCEYGRYVKKGGFVSVQTKRGCPYKCIYCVYPQLEGTKYRLYEPERVVDEVERVVTQAGENTFFFSDSVFNSPREHALKTCRAIIKRQLNIRWMAYCNPIGFDEELARAMKESGCAGVEFGLDSVTEKMIDVMGKPFSQKDIYASMEAGASAGLPMALYLLFGGPGETLEDVREAQKFLQSCPTPNAVFACIGIRIYKGAPIHRRAIEEGVIDESSDLFEPVYYVSKGLGEKPIENIDGIARARWEWSTPTDWDKLPVRMIQKFINWQGIRPQWRDISNYGRYMRR